MRHLFAALAVMALAALGMQGPAPTQEASGAGTLPAPITGSKEIAIERGYTAEAVLCVTCHAKETPGIVEGWRQSRMAHVSVSCYECHVVPKGSPMASQCPGVKGTEVCTSPMVSAKTCSRCHPAEAEAFWKSGHAVLAAKPLLEDEWNRQLMYHFEGGEFLGNPIGSSSGRSTRVTGCQMCHGTAIELGQDGKPAKETWPGGVGERYPDGSVGNCTVCHSRHQFSIAEARKPDACGSCHIGPDHPDIEIYLSSKHGQMCLAHGEDWTWDSPPDAWEPGDYTAPTCATCHMSGIGELKTTHNVNERLKWDLAHKRSVVRTGERGDGDKGRPLMRLVCQNCHAAVQTDAIMTGFDSAVDLYNMYHDKATVMLDDLQARNLLKTDPWKDPFQELYYYLWHHTGRRARHGAAMGGPDYAHWHGFFQVFQLYKDMEDLYTYRTQHNAVEELSAVMSTAPY